MLRYILGGIKDQVKLDKALAFMEPPVDWGNHEVTGIDGAVGVDTRGCGLSWMKRVLLEEVPLPLRFEENSLVTKERNKCFGWSKQHIQRHCEVKMADWKSLREANVAAGVFCTWLGLRGRQDVIYLTHTLSQNPAVCFLSGFLG